MENKQSYDFHQESSTNDSWLSPSFQTLNLSSVIASSSSFIQENQKSRVSVELSLSNSTSYYDDDQNKVKPSLAPNKRKSCPNSSMKETKRMRGGQKNLEEMKSWGYDLKLYEDPWKIKKVLTQSDLGKLSRLLLATDLVEKFMLPVLGVDAQRDTKKLERGTQIKLWDVDTETMHYLILKKWVSSKSYVLIGSWKKDFVKRRCLKKGDEIGLLWDPYKHHFVFSIIKYA
ncbi:hypothetical protein L6164_007120 [Bauhinia variegata]|uniref:Uncharacterized protein n=1 Tax=Bauhinia variegata TaxID=167791 RepID=A0ACB9PWI1_BAUVA|nr:hypothetical protein L6164_007120 [Bauhinia variegata]